MAKKITFFVSLVGFLFMTLYAQHMLDSIYAESIPEQTKKLEAISGKLEKLKVQLEKSDAVSKIKLLNEMDCLDMERVLTHFSLATDKSLRERGLFKTCYYAFKDKKEPGYSNKILSSSVNSQMKNISCEYCNDEFKAGFKELMEALQNPEKKTLNVAHKNLKKIFEGKTKK